MPQSGVNLVTTNLMNNESFLNDFREDPTSALEGYHLSDEEREALKSGDPSKIRDIVGDEPGFGPAADIVIVVVL